MAKQIPGWRFCVTLRNNLLSYFDLIDERTNHSEKQQPVYEHILPFFRIKNF